ncbi:MAG: hypothetical protein SWX82_18100 [Cyanobacteriota bacterium]|nr:hypothetical protein [Cyanobacteriota bacterium]
MTNTTTIAQTYTKRQATREDKKSGRLKCVGANGRKPAQIPIILSKSGIGDRPFAPPPKNTQKP